jgi:xanthine dehydrogenase YagS FAD-binding subunit
MKTFQWADTTSVESAIAQLGDGKTATLKAGGVDVVDLLKEHLIEPQKLVNIRNVKALDFVQDDPQSGLRLGPLVTLARIDADPAIRGRYPILADACGKAATPQVRNMATVGGNLLQRPRCWYFRSEDFHCRKKGGERCYAHGGENQYHAIFSNGTCAIVHPSAAATALVALGASVELTGPNNAKRTLPLEKFFVLPHEDVLRENVKRDDELLTAIVVPAPSPTARQAYTKQGEKESFDWPIAEVACVLDVDAGGVCRQASIVLGAAAPAPRRVRAAEQALVGQQITEALATAAADAALSDASPMSENGYKLPLFRTIVRRTILSAANGATKS